jgi:hypothetical protein
MKKQLTLMLFALVILLGIIGNIFGLSRPFTPQATIRFVNSSPANPKFPKGEGYTPLVQFGKPALKRGLSVAGPGTVNKIPATIKVDTPLPPAPSQSGATTAGCVENENEQEHTSS